MYSEQVPASGARAAENRDKRRHVRVEHSGVVEFVAEGRRFSGQAVNISRTGMQVVVDLPESYASVRSIAFSLPDTAGAVDLPCRLVRRQRRTHGGEEHVLGLEFSYESEAQMLLIENYVRDLRRREMEGRRRQQDQRQIPRAACAISHVDSDRPGVRVLGIENLSTEGMLVTFTGPLAPGERLGLGFRIPGDPRTLTLSAEAVYTIENTFREASLAGMRLVDLSEVDRGRLRNYVAQASTASAVAGAHRDLAEGAVDPRYRIEGAQRLAAELHALLRDRVALNLLLAENTALVQVQVEAVHSAQGVFRTGPAPGGHDALLAPGAQAYFSYHNRGGNRYFRTRLVGAGDEGLRFAFPAFIVDAEKRSYGRKLLEASAQVELLPCDPEDPAQPLSGRVLDVSWHGFLCEIHLPADCRRRFEPGQQIRYGLRRELGLGELGVIRHAWRETLGDGGVRLRLGVEAGIARAPFSFESFSEEQWQLHKRAGAVTDGEPQPPLASIPVCYADRAGRKIAGLVNAAGNARETPVVVVPPAFGRKKEALAHLAATLVENFRRRGQELVVVRYDGINRPGESHNDQRCPRRGYEMLRYRLRQSMDDLQATIDFVYDNPLFAPSQVTLLSFSMSALEARRALAGGEHRRVDYWISCMGVPAAQSTYLNILGGVEIIANHKMGVRNGAAGVLGQFIDLDRTAQELVEHKYAYLTDARCDMGQIPIPVLWIYGRHDKWLVPEEIKDIMSIRSAGTRHVVEIPTGHNLHCSDDALADFRLITERLYERLHGLRIDAVNPCRQGVLRLVQDERDRLEARERLRPEQYWQGYLVGSDPRAPGYDIYQDFPEFRQFLRDEVRLLDPVDGDRIADMGCGTGLLLEELLLHAAAGGAPGPRLTILAADIVQDALQRARQRCEALLRAQPGLAGVELSFRKMNLEPNRLIPLARFAENPLLDFNFLRERVEGLRASTCDLLLEKASPELYAAARGAALSAELMRVIDNSLDDGHREALLDCNRAIRFLRRRLEAEDLRPEKRRDLRGPLPVEAYAGMTCADLRFGALSFGEADAQLQYGLPDECFTKIAASLFVSYLFNPELALSEFHRLLVPGGTLVVSTMKPDSDISSMYTDYIRRQQARPPGPEARAGGKLQAAREMLSEAASLFTLAEDGVFRFFTQDELARLLREAGFEDVRLHCAMGDPPQAYVAVGRKVARPSGRPPG